MPEEKSPGPIDEYKSHLDRVQKEILEAMPKEDSVFWKLVTVVLPVFLTSILGVVAYFVQSNINQKLERESSIIQGQLSLTQDYYRERLSAQLSLTQDYYRERLSTYKDVHTRVVALREKTQIAAHQSALDAGLAKPIGELFKAYSNSSIFISHEVLTAVTALWSSAVGATRREILETVEIKAVASAADAVETAMRNDLRVDELGAPSPAPAPSRADAGH